MAWNRSDDTSADKSRKIKAERDAKKKTVAKGAIAFVLVVAVASIAGWLIFGSAGEKPKAVVTKEKPKLIKEQEPSKAAVAPAKEEKKIEEETDPAKRIVEVVSCTTNKGTDQICRVYRTADGKKHKEYAPAHKPMFKHGTDTLLAMLLSGRKSGIVPPMPLRPGKSLDEEFRASLNDPIVIDADDSEERAARKREVMQAREDVKAMMDSGLTFREIISESRRLFQENAEIRNEAMRELKKIHEQGDAEGERKYQITIDAALEQMGIEPLDTPMTAEERRAKIAEAKALKQQKENAK